MRKKIFMTILLGISFLFVNAQITTTKKAFETVPSTKLPYEGIVGETSIPPRASVYFPYKVWGNKIDTSFWIDYGLTVSTPIEEGDCNIFRRFVPTNGQYFIGVINLGLRDYTKKLLITATHEGGFIDCLDVAVMGSTKTGVEATIKQWKIDANMVVTTYQIKPTSTTPIKFEDTAPLSRINAQRIDTQYQIDASGHISKIKEIKYQPQDYIVDTFTENKNIWDGKEQRIIP